MAFFDQNWGLYDPSDFHPNEINEEDESEFLGGWKPGSTISKKDFGDLAAILPLVSLSSKSSGERIQVPSTVDKTANDFARYINMKWSQYLRSISGFINGKDAPLSLAKFARYYLSCHGRLEKKTFIKSMNEASAAKEWSRKENGENTKINDLTKVFQHIQSEILKNDYLTKYKKIFMADHTRFVCDVINLDEMYRCEEIDKRFKSVKVRCFLRHLNLESFAIIKGEDLMLIESNSSRFKVPNLFDGDTRRELDLLRKRLLSKRSGQTLLRQIWTAAKSLKKD